MMFWSGMKISWNHGTEWLNTNIILNNFYPPQTFDGKRVPGSFPYNDFIRLCICYLSIITYYRWQKHVKGAGYPSIQSCIF